MNLDRVQVGGRLLLVGSLVFIVLLQVAELVYPGYSVRDNRFSDLGATCSYAGTYWPHDCVYYQPASALITADLVALGLFLLSGIWLMRSAALPGWLTLFLALAGVGCIGAGVLSEEFAPYHAIFGLLVFLCTPLAALVSFRFLPRFAGYLSLVLGSFSLGALVILVTVGGEVVAPTWTPLGLGGMEVLVVYLELLWLVVFGATLAALPSRPGELEASTPSAVASLE